MQASIKTMIKVLFDHQIFFQQRYGGISRYFTELATKLDTMPDYKTRVIAPLHINAYLKNSSARSFLSNFHQPNSKSQRDRLIRTQKKLTRKLYRFFSGADIVHETYYSKTPTGHGKHRVLTVYDMIHELFPEQFGANNKTTIAKKAAVARADHIICISESTRRDLIRLFNIDPNKTSVVYLGYSLPEIRKPAPTRITTKTRPYILYVGNREGYKNFMRVCEAISESDTLKEGFDVVAFGGEKFNETETASIKKLGLEGRVHYATGDDDLLASHYRNASVFVYPSLYEGFGIPPLEAMSYDCPVACSETSSIPEVVADAGAYFDPRCTKSIRTTLEKVLSNPDFRQSLIEEGRQRLAFFSWEKCAIDTARVYRNLISQTGQTHE